MKLLVDANNIGYIAHYSTGELSIEDLKTGTIFGFLRIIFSVAMRFDTNEIIFCWDSKDSYREQVYSNYKKARRERELTEEEEYELLQVKRQFVELRKYVLPKMGFRNILLERGYEGDDLIAGVIANNKNEDFCIVSSDGDLYQLLSNKVFMFNQSTKQKMTLKRFKLEYNLSPRKWALGKAIGGCNSDSVKGIKGAADPSNNPQSKALSYIRGELTSGKIYDRIVSKRGQRIISRNLKLIKLPLQKGSRELKVSLIDSKYEKFERLNWIEVFERYDFRFFLMNEQFDRLIEIFSLC